MQLNQYIKIAKYNPWVWWLPLWNLPNIQEIPPITLIVLRNMEEESTFPNSFHKIRISKYQRQAKTPQKRILQTNTFDKHGFRILSVTTSSQIQYYIEKITLHGPLSLQLKHFITVCNKFIGSHANRIKDWDNRNISQTEKTDLKKKKKKRNFSTKATNKKVPT